MDDLPDLSFLIYILYTKKGRARFQESGELTGSEGAGREMMFTGPGKLW
jgi:hypothetical protein